MADTVSVCYAVVVVCSPTEPSRRSPLPSVFSVESPLRQRTYNHSTQALTLATFCERACSWKKREKRRRKRTRMRQKHAPPKKGCQRSLESITRGRPQARKKKRSGGIQRRFVPRQHRRLPRKQKMQPCVVPRPTAPFSHQALRKRSPPPSLTMPERAYIIIICWRSLTM